MVLITINVFIYMKARRLDYTSPVRILTYPDCVRCVQGIQFWTQYLSTRLINIRHLRRFITKIIGRTPYYLVSPNSSKIPNNSVLHDCWKQRRYRRQGIIDIYNFTRQVFFYTDYRKIFENMAHKWQTYGWKYGATFWLTWQYICSCMAYILFK